MTIRRANDVAWRRIDRETVAVQLSRHWMYAFNEPGTRIWDALAEPIEGDQLAQLLSDPAAIAFLADLAAEGLVENDDPFPELPTLPPTGESPAPPRIEWREEVHRFAGGCAHFPAQGVGCTNNPGLS
jgi:hypothetical protein